MINPTDKLCDILSAHPEAEAVLLTAGMDCMHCSSLPFDTVADGCEIHRQDLGYILSLLNRSTSQ